MIDLFLWSIARPTCRYLIAAFSLLAIISLFPAGAAALSASEARGYLESGQKALDAGKPKDAGDAFQRALQAYQEIGDREGEAKALFLLADAAGGLQNFASAEKYYRRGLGLIERHADQATLARKYGVLAVILERRLDPESAKVFYEKSLAIYQARNRGGAVAHSYISIARIELSQGQTDEARRRALQAQEIAEVHEDGPSIISAISMLGMIARAQGDVNKACDYWTSALERMKTLVDEKKIEPVKKLQGINSSPAAIVFFQTMALYGQNKCQLGKREHYSIKLPGTSSLDNLWPIE